MMPRRPRGFTLFEMVLVIVVVGILTAGLAPLMLRQSTNEWEAKDRVALEAAQTAIVNYAISFGGIPDPVETSVACSATLSQVPGLMPPVSGCPFAVSAFGVNPWGAAGNGYLFRLDVNDALKSRYVTSIASSTNGTTGTPAQSGGDRVVFCQAVQQQLALPGTEGYCSNPVFLTAAACTGSGASWTTPRCSNGTSASKAACVAAGATWAQAPLQCTDTGFNHLDATASCTVGTINGQVNAFPHPIPAAFVLVSTGNDRVLEQQNRLANTLNVLGQPSTYRVYESSTRGIINAPGNDHMDDVVLSYPLTSFARDCREKMGIANEVMACAPGEKYVGNITNATTASQDYFITGDSSTISVPANNFTVYVNKCYARSARVYTSSAMTTQYTCNGAANSCALATIDTNFDGRVDIVISNTPTATAQ